MTPITAVDPASKVAYTFTDTGSLHNAIKTLGYIPLRKDGSPFNVQYLQQYDGYVLDGAPLNVWIDGVWLDGQKEALQPLWASGQVPQPPANVLNITVAPMPAQVAAQTAAYQQTLNAGGGFLGMDTGTLVAVGAGLLGIVLLSRGKGRGHSSGSRSDFDF